MSAPLNIWNDHQDSMSVRDAGWIQLHSEDNQEAADLHMHAFRIAEQTHLPVMVCMDGFILTHAYRAGRYPRTARSGRLPARFSSPGTSSIPGGRGAWDSMPIRGFTWRPDIHLHRALEKSEDVISRGERRLRKGLRAGRAGDSSRPTSLTMPTSSLSTMGSVVGNDQGPHRQARRGGQQGGTPADMLLPALPPAGPSTRLLRDKQNIVVLEKAISLGRGGILASDVRWSFPRPSRRDATISSFVAGLGGRNISLDDLRCVVDKVAKEPVELEFLGLRRKSSRRTTNDEDDSRLNRWRRRTSLRAATVPAAGAVRPWRRGSSPTPPAKIRLPVSPRAASKCSSSPVSGPCPGGYLSCTASLRTPPPWLQAWRPPIRP
ncbi:MAG: hypothetical protein MZV70_58720 [Desulfobacterales bacterium]|nr:hypothetical protein [Desulfobacterales bacterium]